MTSDRDGGSPPGSTRFKKGQSGNPKGRPKGNAHSSRELYTSVFDSMFEKTREVTVNGVPREVTTEEALQLQRYQKATKGDRSTINKVFKVINEREQWISQHEKPKLRTIELLSEIPPHNADEAMLILEIATIDQDRQSERNTTGHLLLETWAVQAALSRRRGGVKLNEREISDIERHTRNSETLRFARGTRR